MEPTSVAKPPADREEVLSRVEQLTEPEEVAFALCGAFAPSPATMDITALTAMLGPDVEDPSAVIDKLVGVGLLQKQGEKFSITPVAVEVALGMLD